MAVAPSPIAVVLGRWGVDSGVNALMNSAWGWPVAEIVHFVGICLLFAAVGMFDLRMIGVVRGPPLAALHRLIPFGVAGFGLCLASGVLFVLAAPLEYIQNPAWQIKMALIALAGLNMVLFYLTTARAVRALAPEQAPPPAARAFAFVSLAAWVAVIACGRVITAFRPFIG